MGVVFTRDSNYAKEQCRWNALPSEFGPGGRPFVQREYPMMTYKAARVEGKGIVVTDQHVVQDEQELRNLESRGFYGVKDGQPGHVRAIAAIEHEQLVHGTLAAERNWEIAHGRISEKAAAEVRAHEEAHGATHMPEVPRTPIKRRGRPVKAKEPVSA